MNMPPNIERETAEQNIAILKQRVTGPNGQNEKLPSAHQTAALNALSNEHEIIRLTKRITLVLENLARDYTAMVELFSRQGERMVHEIKNELPQLAAQLKCRKEARNLYADLLG